MSDDIKTVEMLETELKKQEKILSDGLKEHELKWTKAMKDAEAKILALETEKKEIEKGFEKRLSDMEVITKRPDFGGEKKTRLVTPGQRFVMSETYQGMRDVKGMKTDSFEVGNFEVKSDPIEGAVRGDLPPDRAPVWSQRENEIIYEPGQRAFNVMALLAVSPASSNLLEYFREDAQSGGGPGSQDHETHVKNQLGITFAKVSRPIETIAGWIPISRQVLDDAPQLQSYIDGRLMYAVNAEAEHQVLFGDGADGELLGIMNTPNVQTLAAPVGNNTNLDQIRRAIAMVRVNEYAATGIVLNPNDFCEIELLKDADLRYIWVNVSNGGEMRLWRVPVVESTVMEDGQYLLGAFGMGAKVFERQNATIRISESHEDYFTHNTIVVLGERRLGLAVYRPTAFVKGLLSTWSSS
jgi:HK97 family phage major capsid protein